MLPPDVPHRRRVRVTHYCSWADALEEAEAFLDHLPGRDLRGRVADPTDARMVQMARLDCDWHGENVRCFSRLTHPAIEFLPARVVGASGMLAYVQDCSRRSATAEEWLVFMGQQPQGLAGTWDKLGPILRRQGVRLLFYAFDEASRTMPCFPELAPHLDCLIHDENPLDGKSMPRLRPDCRRLHRSWVANLIPYSIPFVENPEEKILFLGSQLGLTPHRRMQLTFLQKRFKNQLIAISDHSLPVAERGGLSRYKVSLCPEGRKFAAPAMQATHTDRPFWSGCSGMVPVSENSIAGGRLETLAQAGLILRYEHGDLDSLETCCARALSLSADERRRIYEHFNREETVGVVVAEQIAAFSSRPAPQKQNLSAPNE